MSFFKRHTDHQVTDILTDPALPFMIGRLVGTSEMASHLMRDHTTTDSALYKQGEMLQKVCDWFFDPSHMPTTVRTNYGREISVDSSQQETQIREEVR